MFCLFVTKHRFGCHCYAGLFVNKVQDEFLHIKSVRSLSLGCYDSHYELAKCGIGKDMNVSFSHVVDDVFLNRDDVLEIVVCSDVAAKAISEAAVKKD